MQTLTTEILGGEYSVHRIVGITIPKPRTVSVSVHHI